MLSNDINEDSKHQLELSSFYGTLSKLCIKDFYSLNIMAGKLNSFTSIMSLCNI